MFRIGRSLTMLRHCLVFLYFVRTEIFVVAHKFCHDAVVHCGFPMSPRLAGASPVADVLFRMEQVVKGCPHHT